MTVEEFLKTVPEEKREEMAEFYYSRVPYRFIPKGTADQNIPASVHQSYTLSRTRSV